MENSEAKKDASHRRVKHRSPSYPSIDLAKALQRAQQLQDVAGRHPAPLESATKSWGYSPKSSGGLQTVASLKQYGLVEDSGKGFERQVSLTKAAQELLVYGANQDSPEWRTRAQVAALRPKVHKKLWEKYGGSLPDDSVMLPYLKLELSFSDEAATDMLKRFRATIAFAGVSDESDTQSDSPEDIAAEVEAEPTVAAAPSQQADLRVQPGLSAQPGPLAVEEAPSQRTVQITYSPSAWALLQAPFPLSETDWDAMIETLNGMKRGLVQPDD